MTKRVDHVTLAGQQTEQGKQRKQKVKGATWKTGKVRCATLQEAMRTVHFTEQEMSTISDRRQKTTHYQRQQNKLRMSLMREA